MEIIFSVGNIFNAKSAEGALYQHGATHYYIAPYQRGYKWSSIHSNDHVCILMKDLLDAVETPSSEYYLQFITTKVTENNGKKILEVIDGQQRLTTLTILLSVIAYKKGQTNTAISNNLLLYEVRPNVTEFFDKHIYSNIDTILTKSWQDFLVEYPDNNEQDIFYLFNAANKINEILNDEIIKDDDKDIEQFEKYVLDNVKIILNNIERNINCEEMFSNLNDNKVDLTSSELIKGLILTKTPREKTDPERRISYKEILEMRAVMGRQWDDLSHWANRFDIKSFFFSSSYNVLDELLLLLALKDGLEPIKDRSEKNEVFNYFQSQIKKEGKSASSYFNELKKLRLILNEWYNDIEIYNSLGFLFFAKNKNRFTIKDAMPLLLQSKTAIRIKLKKDAIKLLPDDITQLEYGKDNNIIYNVLLSLSVFGEDSRFNFTAFNGDDISWSLEHIFPQTPETLSDKLSEKDINLLNSLSKGKFDDFKKVKDDFNGFDDILNTEQVFNSLSQKLKKKECELSFDEKRILYRLIKTDKLNSIGNMALLTKSDNISNKNGMFDKKRHNIAKRVSCGSFVPKHTYDIFSKLLSEQMTPELNAWTETDISKHEEWVINRITTLKNML